MEFKRRITVEQFNELTVEQQNKLRELWKTQSGDIGYWKYGKCKVIMIDSQNGIQIPKNYLVNVVFVFPLLDIGQMIEILGQYNPIISHTNDAHGHKPMVSLSKNRKDLDFKVYADTLCDALWEAVKQIL